MPTRDIWSAAGAQQLPDLIASALMLLLLQGTGPEPVYFSSPWMSDFPLAANGVRQFSALFPADGERSELRFVHCIARLAELRPVRLVVTANETSAALVEHPVLTAIRGEGGALEHRFARPEYHEKGILAPTFYLEGSMNITYSGVLIRNEKVSYHAGDADSDARIARAYLEFGRRWDTLPTDV